MQHSTEGASTRGVIHIHNSDWLSETDDPADPHQHDDLHEQQSPADSLSSASAGPSDAPSPAHPSLPPRPRRSSSRRVPQPFKPKTRGPVSYAEKYAHTTAAPTASGEAKQSEKEVKENLEPFTPSAPHSHADVLVIAPSTPLQSSHCATSASLTSAQPPCSDESTLALRYPEYFPSEEEDEQATSPLLSSASSASPTSASSFASFTPYTLSDFRTLPREVRLGSLGPSTDPDVIERQRQKRRAMKESERRIREQNALRLDRQRREREEEDATSQRGEAKEQSKREKAIAFAATVPKPRPPIPPVPSHRAEPATKARVTRETDVVQHRPRAPAAKTGTRSEAKAEELSSLTALLAQQEAQRVRVQRIRQSLRG